MVLESVQRRRSEGAGPGTAAVTGTRQVFFAVIATTAVLIAVFVPIAFLPGTAGRLFQEFGLVLAVAVAISSFVALSLVPAAMARLAVSQPRERRVEVWGNQLAQGYHRSLVATQRAAARFCTLPGIGGGRFRALCFSGSGIAASRRPWLCHDIRERAGRRWVGLYRAPS